MQQNFGSLLFGRFWLGWILTGFVSVTPCRAEEEQPIEPTPVQLNEELDYQKHVAPILKKNCIACHNATVQEGGLSLETPEAMFKGGSNGESIFAGDPEASFLYLVASRQSEPVMPPLPNKMNAHKLTSAEVWILQQWILKGAKGSDSAPMKKIEWTTVPAHLQPIYSVALFPAEDQFVVGRGTNVEVISLTDPSVQQKLIDPELKTTAHRDFVNAVSVHPSGQYLASAGYRCVKIWEKAVPTLRQTLTANAPWTAFAHSSNQQFYAYASASGTIYYGSAQSGATWESGKTDLRSLAIDDSGKTLALVTAESLQWVDLSQQKMVAETPLESPAVSLLFTDQQLLTGLENGKIGVWGLSQEGSPALQKKQEFSKSAAAVQGLFPVVGDATAVLSVDQTGLVVLWNLTNSAPQEEWATGAETVKATYAPGSKRLATLHAGGQVRIWNDQKKQEREFTQSALALQAVNSLEAELAISKSWVTYVQASLKESEKDLADRKAAQDKAQKTYEEAQAALEKATAPKADAAKVVEDLNKQLAEKPEDAELKKKLEAANKDLAAKQKAFDEATQNEVRLKKSLELEQQSVQRAEAQLAASQAHLQQKTASVAEWEKELAAAKSALAQSLLNARDLRFVNPQELEILTAEGQLQHWNLTTGHPLSTFSLPQTSIQKGLQLSAQQVAFVVSENQIQIYEQTPDWKLRARLGPADGGLEVNESEFLDRVTSLSFSPQGDFLATGGGDPSREGELLLWDWQTGKVARRFADAHSDLVLSLNFSRDGRQLLTGSADKFVKIFDVETGEKTLAFEGHTEHVLGVAWTADGLTVASASADKSIKVWDTQNGSQKKTISTFGKQVTALDFVGTTDKIVSGCGDKVVRMHEAGSGKNYRNLSGATNYLFAVAVSADESIVIGGGQEGVIRIWNGQNGQILHTLAIP